VVRGQDLALGPAPQPVAEHVHGPPRSMPAEPAGAFLGFHETTPGDAFPGSRKASDSSARTSANFLSGSIGPCLAARNRRFAVRFARRAAGAKRVIPARRGPTGSPRAWCRPRAFFSTYPPGPPTAGSAWCFRSPPEMPAVLPGSSDDCGPSGSAAPGGHVFRSQDTTMEGGWSGAIEPAPP